MMKAAEEIKKKYKKKMSKPSRVRTTATALLASFTGEGHFLLFTSWCRGYPS